jgi:RNA polymerase sigma factor (sigma-70 family)
MDHDDQLWRLIGEGKPDAFGDLFARHGQNIFAYCFRRTGQAALAEDLTSVVFLEVWRRRDVRLAQGCVSPWIYGIATNVLRNQWRSMRRHRAALGRLPEHDLQDDFREEVESRVAAEQEVAQLLTELRRLPRGEQEVLALHVLEGLSLREVGLALAIPEVTVRTRLHRSRARLAKTSIQAEHPRGAENW